MNDGFLWENRRLKITGGAVEVRKNGGFIQLRLLGVFFCQGDLSRRV